MAKIDVFLYAACGSITIWWLKPGTSGVRATISRNTNGGTYSQVKYIGDARDINYWVDIHNSEGYSHAYEVALSNGDTGNSGKAGHRCSTSWSTFALVRHREPEQASFELVAPSKDKIIHYQHEPGTLLENEWSVIHSLDLPQGVVVQDMSLSLIQSSFNTLELITRVGKTNKSKDNRLVGHEYHLDGQYWVGPSVIIADGDPIDKISGSHALIQSQFQQQPTFELLVPRGQFIQHFRRKAGSVVDGQWESVAELSPPDEAESFQITSVSLAENSFTDELVAIARISRPEEPKNDYLISYAFSPEKNAWHGPVPLDIDHVTGSPGLLLGNQQAFELLVPQGSTISHFRHKPEQFLDREWQLIERLPPPARRVQPIAVALTLNSLGRLDAIVRGHPARGKDFLLAYERNPETGTWSPPITLHPPIIIESRREDHRDPDD